MNEALIDKIGKEKIPDILFNKVCINRVWVQYSESLFDKQKWNASGRVHFSNGNTNGCQEFSGETFDSVVQQIKNFINSLD